jgi:MinD-like ATPase involved in chromosome partitioning or flagellar assembly
MAFGAYVRSSTSGVSYFAAPEHAADLLELSEAEWLEVVSALVKLDVYDCIVFDIPWGTNKLVQYFLKRSLRTLMVSDGRVGSNDKVSRALDTLRILDQRNSTSFAQGIAVFYNKFSTRNTARIPNLTEAGGINRYEGLGDAAVVDAIVADKRLLAYCQGVFA